MRDYLAASDFRDYLAFALDYKGYDVDEPQLQIADHLQFGGPAVGLFAARGSSKTTIASTHYVNWRHLRCPYTKVLIISGVSEHAERIARDNLRHYKEMPWLKHLAPRGKTGATQYDLAIPDSYKEPTPSVKSVGALGAYTGLRSDLVILDDVVVSTNVTPRKYELVKQNIAEVLNIIRDPSKRPWLEGLATDAPEFTQRVVIGTPHSTTFDLYSDELFMAGVDVRRFPAFREAEKDEDYIEIRGIPGRWTTRFPRIMSNAYLRDKIQGLTPEQVALQYFVDVQLAPDAADQVISLDAVRQHAWDEGDKEAREFKRVALVLDPAGKGSDTYVICVCTPSLGKLYVHDLIGLRNTSSDRCASQVVEIAKQRKACEIHYEEQLEEQGLLLKRKAIDSELRASIKPFHNRKEKLGRIIDSLEPTLNAGICRLHKRLLGKRELIYELKDLRYGRLPHRQDDFIDCLSHAVRVFGGQLRVGGTKLQMTQYVVG